VRFDDWVQCKPSRGDEGRWKSGSISIEITFLIEFKPFPGA
jgi:hypothetical protein